MLAEVLFPSDWDGTAATNLDDASYGEHFATALGFTREAFPGSGSEYLGGFPENTSAGSGLLVGDAMKADLKNHVPGFPTETFQRWASFGWCLLGDPATPFRTELNPILRIRAWVA